MDLTQLDTTKKSNDGAQLQLRSPRDGEVLIDESTGSPVSITLLGPDSKRYLDASHEATNRRLTKRLRSARAKITAEEVAGDQLELLVACTTGWSGIQVDGAYLKFSEDEARKLYKRFPWIRDQAQEFIDERSNFLGES